LRELSSATLVHVDVLDLSVSLSILSLCNSYEEANTMSIPSSELCQFLSAEPLKMYIGG